MKMPDRSFHVTATEGAILRLLIDHREMYGLHMVIASGGRLKRGTVYVLLDRLEDKGFVRSRREDAARAGPIPKRLYQVTGSGQRVVAASSNSDKGLGLPAGAS